MMRRNHSVILRLNQSLIKRIGDSHSSSNLSPASWVFTSIQIAVLSYQLSGTDAALEQKTWCPASALPSQPPCYSMCTGMSWPEQSKQQSSQTIEQALLWWISTVQLPEFLKLNQDHTTKLKLNQDHTIRLKLHHHKETNTHLRQGTQRYPGSMAATDWDSSFVRSPLR